MKICKINMNGVEAWSDTDTDIDIGNIFYRGKGPYSIGPDGYEYYAEFYWFGDKGRKYGPERMQVTGDEYHSSAKNIQVSL